MKKIEKLFVNSCNSPYVLEFNPLPNNGFPDTMELHSNAPSHNNWLISEAQHIRGQLYTNVYPT